MPDRMKYRVMLVLVLCGGAALLSAGVLYPSRMERGALQAAQLPMLIGAWAGTEVEVEEYVKQILETDDVVQRNYLNPAYRDQPVQLAVVYSADNRRVAHPPEVCYRGAGWEMNEKKIVTPPDLRPMVRLILSSSRESRDLVYYCYKAGDEITADYYRQQMNIMRNQIMLKATSSALIRFSTHLDSNEGEADAEKRITEFMRLMMPEIEKTLN